MSVPPSPSGTRTFTIPLGVMDIEVLVHPTGDAWIASPAPVPEALHEVVTKVLETWMIDLPLGEVEGSTMIGQQMWADYFGHRCEVLVDA